MRTNSRYRNAHWLKSSRGNDHGAASAQSPFFGPLCERVDMYRLCIAVVVLLLPGSFLFLPLICTYYAKRAIKRWHGCERPRKMSNEINTGPNISLYTEFLDRPANHLRESPPGNAHDTAPVCRSAAKRTAYQEQEGRPRYTGRRSLNSLVLKRQQSTIERSDSACVSGTTNI